ncbi:MAG TPA: plastocyanin/azurin family copper-binding protein [Solirubrobacterales bacterium]|nr:plastocyanin/azurin family copper-binding protein [Solirubrobacterales bacterium]
MTGRALKKTLSGTALLVAAAACLVAAAPALAASATVDVGSFRYTPQDVTVDQGDTVTWNWVGPDVNHDVYEGVPIPRADPIPPALFESHPWILPDDWANILEPPPGGTYSHLFDTAGTYDYWCRRHPGMTATVTVNAVEQPPEPTPEDPAPVSQLAPPKAECVSKRNFKIRIREPKGGSRLAAVKVTVNGKPVATALEGRRFTAPVDLRGFARGTYEVQIVASTADGQTLRGTRRYRTCAPKAASSSLPPL